MSRQAKALMVLGTTSGAGKSWLTTALCRWYARQGLKVAPFKAQNMSNNARVVPGLQGRMGEIGSAQYFQALAAGRQPEVRMNPVLLKPEADTKSQVVVLGEVHAELNATPWRERSEKLWPHARAALHALMAENDLLLIEGAGSPAEINLHSSDYVNMRTAREARAACLLVTDIDRGGAFAHLYGTHQLLPPEERALIQGFVLNRFRGDARLLSPGPEQLQALTGVPTVATLPMWRGHGLPEEDGVFDDQPTGAGQTIAVVAYPRLSNLDEFQPLRGLPGVRLVWARSPAELQAADWIILPGSKAVAADLAWLREQRLDAAIAAHATAGRPVLGICGGLQMLGEALLDPHALDGNAPGLGLLPLVTQFEREKLLRPCQARFESELAGPWAALGALAASGYEIHHGRTAQHPSLATAAVALRDELGQPIGWQQGSVLGHYVHGLFEQPAVLQALFGASGPSLDQVFDGLADFVDAHFQPGALPALIR
ncbi:cobyric acid synthase [Kinneretia asaccharophila]|uniref:Cobyric acid synthase n=1 Tax=Roseateles asaccharophilus TaxID=582607 RepID=A0A4R6N885_9BURK|nr:cobyric acid synthase [Roseateles asaccharophilus]MDN3545181.1 cobyric acid synthase [Roseateles asaccharophilus]TDP11432.1 adenosylcobyric acid synthase (glutamine-hydrolysing) [Roseateles asaccharophilus]